MAVPILLASEAVTARARGMVSWGYEPVYSLFDWVNVSTLLATQDEVSVETVDALMGVGSPAPIHVARLGPSHVIVDGHHRATVATLLKRRLIFASVCTLSKALPDAHSRFDASPKTSDEEGAKKP